MPPFILPTMLSTTADHALRAVLFLARQRGTRLTSAEEIAHAIGAPSNYLSKVLHQLRRSGVVASSPGRQGGFSLAICPTQLTIADVVGQFEPAPATSRCLLGDRLCDPDTPCEAHSRWASIRQAYRIGLATTTIAELLSGDEPVGQRVEATRSARARIPRSIARSITK